MKQRPVSVLTRQASAEDPATDKAIEDLRRQIGAPKLLDGAQLLEDVAITTAAFARVAHRLRRRPKGYAVVRVKSTPGAAYSLFDDNDNRTDSDRFLYLRTVGANVTADLVVF